MSTSPSLCKGDPCNNKALSNIEIYQLVTHRKLEPRNVIVWKIAEKY